MRRKEYGGYIEFETFKGEEYHPRAIPLNCGRNCLAYLIKARRIKKIYLPYFLCASVEEVCEKYGAKVAHYHIDENFSPVFDKKPEIGGWFYFVNYYGQFSDEEIAGYKERFGGRFIADYSQAFFQKPLPSTDTLYTCRKFFGVPDGAYLYTDAETDVPRRDVSFERMRFLLGRYEKSAEEFYLGYVQNNELFRGEDIKMTSRLTRNLLRGIDYDSVKNIRTRNFLYLHRAFSDINRLDLKVPEGAFMYPLYVPGGRKMRIDLQSKKIYVPTLWPEVLGKRGRSDIEYSMAADILPLPVDQRYDEDDMEYIAGEARKCSGLEN